MTDQLLQDKWDMMIDKFEELRRLNPQQPIIESIAKINNDFNYQMDVKFAFHLCRRILEFWMDMEDDYYNVLTSWVIGTYFFDIWVSFPYLFINAVKASGKTRLLKLLAYLTNGVYTMSLKEAVLFRMPSIKKCGLFIDETEQISNREKGDLRELLLVAYKKGTKIFRTRKNITTEKYVIDEFELFIPVAMANIGGMDDVLSDRCLSIVLERSYNSRKTNLPEIFDQDEKITLFKYLMFDNSLVSLVHVDIHKTIYSQIPFILHYNTNDTNDTNDTINISNIFNKGVVSRDFELWFPLLVTKHIFTEESSDLLDIAVKFTQERKLSNVMEDRDTSMLIFLAKFILNYQPTDWINYNDICHEYNESEGIDSKSHDAMKGWLLTRILKRLKIVVDKRRLSTTRQIKLDFEKIKRAIDKMGIIIESNDNIEKNIDNDLQQTLIKDDDFDVDSK